MAIPVANKNKVASVDAGIWCDDDDAQLYTIELLIIPNTSIHLKVTNLMGEGGVNP